MSENENLTPPGTAHTVVSVDSDGPIEQADILASVADKPAYSIVVTGDCDLAQDKAWDCIHCVPLVSAHSYMHAKFGYDSLRSFCAIARGQLGPRLGAGEGSSFSPAAIEDAIFAQDRDALGEVSSDAKCVRKLRALADAEALLRTAPARNEEWPDSICDLLVSRLLEIAQSIKQATGSVPAKWAERLHDAPDDVFLITDLLPDTVHVALLRFIRSLPSDEIASTIGQARGRGCTHYRVGRVLAPYRYELTRRLGAVFSDIGLPSEYESRRRSHIENMKTKLGVKPP